MPTVETTSLVDTAEIVGTPVQRAGDIEQDQLFAYNV